VFSPLFRFGALRRKLAFELRCRHFEDLEIAVPIGEGLRCPILHPEYWHSFEEIFFTNEYSPLFEMLPPPERWIDLGCHAGFFSLLMALWRRRRKMDGSFTALLIDGDSRVARSIERMSQINAFGSRFKFLHGAIASEPGDVRFDEKEVMASSLTADPRGKSVKVVRPEVITGLFPAPYDLVKVDIEGAEKDFLTSYGAVIAGARHVLLEWHSWSLGGGSVRQAAARVGLKETAEIVPEHSVAHGGTCGVVLFEKR
jgi:FkbM family methyltransferase